MKHCVRTKRFIIAVLAILSSASALLAGSCTREGDSTLGYEFLPEEQQLQTRHKSFKGGAIRKYDSKAGEYVEDAGHKFFETRHFRTDSLVSSNLQTGYFGIQNDPENIFGMREAGFASEFLFTSSIAEGGFGYLPIFDSMQLVLSITDYAGDTIRPINYTIYEITGKSLSESMTETNGEEKEVAYINHDMSGLYDSSKPLFTFTFPDPDNGITTATTGITLKPADMNGATWDFIKRLMLAGDLNEGWDGYADDTAIYESDSKWVEAFKGVFIKPEGERPTGSDEGGMYATDLSATGLVLYGRNRNPEEPRLIKDTVSMGYVFYDANATEGGNRSINYVVHDYTGSKLQEGAEKVLGDRKREESDTNFYAWRDENRLNHTESATVYAEGMGGMVTELYLTDDLLRELRNINIEEGFSHAAINQAMLYIYLEGSDYDWGALDPEAMTPLLDASLPRLGLYTNLEALSPVPDYNYYYEANYGTTLNYGGYLGRSLACYTMDISGYIQQLKNYIDRLNPDADDDFDYNDSVDGFNSADSDAVSRILYVAPEAYSMYALKRSRMQGGEDAANKASIRLELTYTMIK